MAQSEPGRVLVCNPGNLNNNCEHLTWWPVLWIYSIWLLTCDSKMFMLVHICTINNTTQSHTAWSVERKLSISEVLYAFHNITNYIYKLSFYQHFFFAICVSFSCLNKSVIYAVRNFTLRFLVSWLYPCFDCCGLRCSTCVSWASVLPPDPCWRRDSRVDTLTGETTAFLSLAPNTTCVQFTPL